MFNRIRRSVLAGVAAGALLLCTALPSAAQAHLTFAFVNNSGWVVSGLYVDPSGAKQWGQNVLQAPMDVAGGAVEVTFSGYGDTCLFDVAAEFTDGSWWYMDKFDFCAVSVVTLNPDNVWTKE